MAFKKLRQVGLSLLMLLGFGTTVAAQEMWPVNFDKESAIIGREDRWMRAVSIDDQTVSVWQKEDYEAPVYVDLTAQKFTVTAGKSVVPAVDWVADGSWMHSYVYVDWNNDGTFTWNDVSDEGVIGDGQEIVSFSYWSPADNGRGYNSAGEAVGDGPGQLTLPAFVVPAETPAGEYRIRFKIDWDNLDPGGTVSGDNIFVRDDGTSSNAGTIIDLTLVVEEPAKKFKANCTRGFLAGKTPDSGQALTGVGTAEEASEFAIISYDDHTYLYDVTNKGFVINGLEDVSNMGGNGNPLYLSATNFAQITTDVQIGNTQIEDYPYFFYDQYENYLNMDGQKKLYFNGWRDFEYQEYGASGNAYRIEYTEILTEEELAEAVAMLEDYFHPAATYSIVVVDAESGEEYTVAENISAEIGAELSEMPADYALDFCEYTVEDVLSIAEGNENVLRATVTYNLPFEEGKWYNMTVRGMYAVYDGSRPVITQRAQPDATVDGGLWQFSGNPYAGVLVTNRAAGEGYALSYDEVVVPKPGTDVYMKDGADTRWLISKNQNGFVLRLPENNTIYLHNRTPNLSTCSVQEWAGVHEDAGSTINITEVEVGDDPIVEDEFTFTISQGTGGLSGNGTSNWQNYWKSYSQEPYVEFANPSAANLTYSTVDAPYIDIRTGRAETSLYTITVSPGYLVTGYHITGIALQGDQTINYGVPAPYTFTSEAETTLDVVFEEPVETFQFTATGANSGLKAYIVLDMKKLNTAPVNFTVTDKNDNTWFSAAQDVEVGTTLTELPENLKKPFTEYTYGDPCTVEKDVENQFSATANFTAFPISNADAEFPVYIQTGNDLYFYATDNGLTAIEAAPEAEDDAYRFVIYGNPYDGFTVKSVATGSFINVPSIASFSSKAGLSDEATTFAVNATEDDKLQFIVPTEGGRLAALGDGVQSNGAYPNENLCAWISYMDGTQTSAHLYFTPAGAVETTAEVNYWVLDEEGSVLESVTTQAEVGTPVETVPENMQRPWTTYTPSGEFIVGTNPDDNTFIFTATFNEPFPTVDKDGETEAQVYILTNQDKTAFGGIDGSSQGFDGFLAVFNDEALAAGAEGDLTDTDNWALDGSVNDPKTVLNPNFAEASFAIHPEYIFTISGNPYKGYTVTNGDGKQLLVDGVTAYNTSAATFVDDEGTVFELIPTTGADAPVAPRNGVLLADMGEYYFWVPSSKSYLMRNELLPVVASTTLEKEKAAPLHLVKVDLDEYDRLKQEWLTSISKMETVTGNAATFDLQGRRANKAQKGIYIINGKKVLVK